MMMILQAALLAAFARGETKEPPLIPRPAQVLVNAGEALLDARTVIDCRTAPAAVVPVAERFAAWLRARTGLPLPLVKAGGPEPQPGLPIRFIPYVTKLAEPGEEYAISILPGKIDVGANGPRGAFNAVQTLRQLLPAAIEGSDPSKVRPALPCVTIADRPRFGWRGLHLDESRHFFGKQHVLRTLDLMALHKLNVFHWHLTDSQGWRWESKKYPKLTSVGAWRGGIGFGFDKKLSDAWDAQGRYGGYYTQDDVREIIAFAADRNIMIVPEIEIPGHAQALVAAYPELSCTGAAQKVADDYGDQTCDVVCASNPQTYQFLKDVVGELAALFPGAYVHVGGDEVNPQFWKACSRCIAFCKERGFKSEHELQAYFEGELEKMLSANGKKLVGWDEILEGGLPPSAVVMSWRGVGGGIAAAKAGHDVVMSPTSHCYFDMAQALSGEPQSAGGLVTLRRVYGYDPMPRELSPDEGKHLLGVQANLWTEHMPNAAQVEYMTWPRACALAETGWTGIDRKDFADFQTRLVADLARLDAIGVRYRKPRPDDDPKPPALAAPGAITSTFDVYGQSFLENAFDGNPETYFWSDGAPKPGDSITLRLDKPVTARSIQLLSGKPGSPDDVLDSDLVQVEPTSGGWRQLGAASGADVTLTVGDDPIRAVQIRVVKPHGHWLVLREIAFTPSSR